MTKYNTRNIILRV